MILSRTPIRITFTGGGTDIQAYYSKYGGAVVNAAINKYIYIGVNKRFEDKIRVSYSTTEIVGDINQLKHGPVRECLKDIGINKEIEITSMADIPGRGTGLGSSSAFTVGLLNALYAYQGKRTSADELAKEAVRIEREVLQEPGGKQDQYIAAYGGLRLMEFRPDEGVSIEEIPCKPHEKERLTSNLLLFYLGLERQAEQIQAELKANAEQKKDVLDRMKQTAFEIRRAISVGDFDSVGRLLNEGWQQKKKLAGGITNPLIEKYYNKAIEAGALGGKIMGSGGGGFFIFYCPEDKHESVKSALSELRYTPFSFEGAGSQIVFNDHERFR
jgi:D-glycero-alpha-D-manno-heptose-7-phosphate kinase